MDEIFVNNKNVTRSLEEWQEKNGINAQYRMPINSWQMYMPTVLDYDGLMKISKYMTGYMLAPVWSNETFVLEAKTRVAKTFEELIAGLEKLKAEGKYIFLYTYYYVPSFPVHKTIDPNTFEAIIPAVVSMSTSQHWRIRYATLEPVQPGPKIDGPYIRQMIDDGLSAGLTSEEITNKIDSVLNKENA